MVMGNYSAKQRRLSAEIEGAKEIISTLQDMENEASKILLSAVKKGGDIALSDAKRNCPVDTGRLKSSLKLNEKKFSNTKATASVDYDKSLRYGVGVELGTNGRQPNPFMRKAVDDNIVKIDKSITDEITRAILKRW